MSETTTTKTNWPTEITENFRAELIFGRKANHLPSFTPKRQTGKKLSVSSCLSDIPVM